MLNPVRSSYFHLGINFPSTLSQVVVILKIWNTMIRDLFMTEKWKLLTRT